MIAPAAVTSYCDAVAIMLRSVLGESLSGVYLHGSGAMGGWVAEFSDVDLLAVADRPLTAGEKEAVVSALSSTALQAPGVGLEFSLVYNSSFELLTSKPPFELHITTGDDSKVVDGARHPGDSDLVMHYAVCRARGLAIFGPVPRMALPDVPRRMLLAAFADEVVWGLEHAQPRYAVLNACRAWAFAQEGRLLSKVEGGSWAIEFGVEVEAIRTALAAQRGGIAAIDRVAAEGLVAWVRGTLLSELEATGNESG